MSRSQRIRKGLIVGSALLFPITMVYFSPAMVFRGARLGIVSGSYLTFAMLFIAALVFGRAWCGWLCPVAGLSALIETADARPFRARRAKAVKYAIWVVWLAAIALVATLVGGGFSSVDPFLGTAYGITVHSLEMLAVYYLVIALIVVPTLVLGRRGFCHTLCWMAPFMVLGRKLGLFLRLPSLRLRTTGATCRDCGGCQTVCPMSLPVADMVRTGPLERADCILCGSCVSACPGGVLSLRFGVGTHQDQPSQTARRSQASSMALPDPAKEKRR